MIPVFPQMTGLLFNSPAEYNRLGLLIVGENGYEKYGR